MIQRTEHSDRQDKHHPVNPVNPVKKYLSGYKFKKSETKI